ncbi:MAG: TIR domain-containing protein [Promethearchaeota archaeon]
MEKVEDDTFGVKIEGDEVLGLGLYDCELSTLPESIENLTSLQRLWLNSNKLKTLPESFSQLKSLKKIYLKENDWKGEWKEMATNDIPTILKLCRKLNGIIIFISHAMRDQGQYRVKDLKNNLEKSDIIHGVYLCEEDLRDSIQEFMAKNVPRSQLLIFIGTKNSLVSKDCLYELSLAQKYDVKILPIKGPDVKWGDLNQIDLRKHQQGVIALSKVEGFNFNAKNFDKICDKLHEYIKKHESELKILKKEQEKLDKEKSNILKNVIDFADSSEFRDHLKENLEEFKKIFQDVSNNRITNFEYILKLGDILKKKIEN